MGRIYVGSGKPHKQFEDALSITIDMDKAQERINEFQGKRYLNLDITKLREPDKYGRTHSISYFIPDRNNSNESNASTQSNNNTNQPDPPF